MPPYIQTDVTAALVIELARPREPDLLDRLKQFYRENPMPAPTDLTADKRFFDELSGEL